ncbi:isopentenyl-diphosphate Delta-isomerase [Lonsdalea quercina]|uniref:isopentenyl-diphosphate Delta-isomerase n=1 Tax=Lonsdalea quercina TaxID=71657 RepID=UPI0039750ED6
MTSPPLEHVVLLDADRNPIGTMDKSVVHSDKTPLHLAFSSYLFSPAGQFLTTRRALCKKAWPGVWTNSVCGHPQLDEKMEAAVRRRCRYELGADVDRITLADDEFSYCVTSASGIMENEYCPVFTAVITSDLSPRDDEVLDYRWVDLPDLIDAATKTPWAFSPWMVQQLAIPALQRRLRSFAAMLTAR